MAPTKRLKAMTPEPRPRLIALLGAPKAPRAAPDGVDDVAGPLETGADTVEAELEAVNTGQTQAVAVPPTGPLANVIEEAVMVLPSPTATGPLAKVIDEAVTATCLLSTWVTAGPDVNVTDDG